MEASAGSKTTRGYSSTATNNKKGPAPLASFDEISVLSLDVSSPSDKGNKTIVSPSRPILFSDMI